MTTGQTIRALRKRRGLTQAQLGALCGLSGGAVSSYENGATRPRRRTAERIARVLEVPPERLMEPEAAPAPPERPEPGEALLYGGVLDALRELYGPVEGRVILGENGARRTYYLVGDFVLYERDIAAIARSAGASLASLASCLRQRPGPREAEP